MTITTNPEFPLTSEYHLNSKSGDPNSPLLVFIPGNPGLIDYYTTYLDLISDKFPEYDILAIGHAGFQTSGDYVADSVKQGFVFYDLEYQIAHKCNILKKQILQGHTRISFLCHSVGGYITQRVVLKLMSDEEIKKTLKIDFVGLICPTIVDIAKSESGVLFGKLFTYLPLIHLAVGFLFLLQLILPDSALQYIISNFVVARPERDDVKSMEAWENAKNATLKICKSRRIVQQAFTLAREELQVIHRDDNMNDWFFEYLPTCEGLTIWCFFANSDYWVHDNTRDYILTRYHNAESERLFFQIGSSDNEHSKAITHSFCVDQSVEFADITCEALRGNQKSEKYQA